MFEEFTRHDNCSWRCELYIGVCTSIQKLKIDVAHVEAGLRSGDKVMPEEINRIATDAISDLFFASEPSAIDNLQKEGHPKELIHHVGNVMIDSLFYHLDEIASRPRANSPIEALKRSLKDYCVVTLHRPSNVDVSDRLGLICDTLNEVAKTFPLIFPVHPRTKQLLQESGRSSRLTSIYSSRCHIWIF